MAYPKKTSPEAIRAVAINLLEKEGEAALTIRRVASELGLAPNALYRHFATRDVLIAAIADEVAKRLLAAINKALGNQKPKHGKVPAERQVRTFASNPVPDPNDRYGGGRKRPSQTVGA